MKKIAILILTIIAVSAHGQENSTTGFKRFQIGINISPDICFRTLNNNDGSYVSDIVIKLRDRDETIKIGYTAGLNFCYNITSYFGLETGIQYSEKGFQHIQTEFYPNQPDDPTMPDKAIFKYHFRYIDIPLKANFTIGKKKVRFFTSVGLTTNIFITEIQTEILIYGNRKVIETNPTLFDYKKVNLSPTISAGIDYKINSRMNLRVEPTYRFGVIKIIDTPVSGWLWNAGLNISYYFGFNPNSNTSKKQNKTSTL